MILRAKEITKSYENRPILKKIDLTIEKNEKIAITGMSGSGKTTLLNILGTLEPYDSGNLDILGIDPKKQKALLPSLRNEQIGFIFQFHHLIPEMSVIENILLPQQIQRKKNDPSFALDLLNRLQLLHLKEAKVENLSGGEKQRIALIRAYINHPQLILADEPTGNLDPLTSKIIIDYLLTMEHALILVTHEKEMAKRCSRRFELIDGFLQEW